MRSKVLRDTAGCQFSGRSGILRRDGAHRGPSRAARSEAAGVDVRLSIYADIVHVWHLMREATPEAQRAIDEIAAFARGRTAAGSTMSA